MLSLGFPDRGRLFLPCFSCSRLCCFEAFGGMRVVVYHPFPHSLSICGPTSLTFRASSRLSRPHRDLHFVLAMSRVKVC